MGLEIPRQHSLSLSHRSSPRNSPSLHTTQGWGKGLAGAPHQPPSTPKQSTGHQQDQSLSLPPENCCSGKPGHNCVSSGFISPSTALGKPPHIRPGYSTQSPSASPKTFPKIYLPTVPRSSLLRLDTAHPHGDQLPPKNHPGLPPHHGSDPFHHLSVQL